jgi:hypothetical protein
MSIPEVEDPGLEGMHLPSIPKDDESEEEGEQGEPMVSPSEPPQPVGGDEPHQGEGEHESDHSSSGDEEEQLQGPGDELGQEGVDDSASSSDSENHGNGHPGEGEWQSSGESSPTISQSSGSLQSVVIALREDPEPRRSTRVSRPPVTLSPTMKGNHIYRRAHANNGQAFVAAVPLARWSIPRSVAEANRSSLSQYWLDARLVELSRLDEMQVYELVEPPPGANILQSLWVFAVKLKPDNSVDRFKARLVVNGSGQKEGIDFEETFASTAGRSTIRMFLAMCCVLGLLIDQLDVTTAFLYGDVDKEIYMRQPPGHKDGSGRVCRLRRSLYGLKQAPRIWGETLLAIQCHLCL